LAEGLITLVTDTPLEKLCRDLIGVMTRAVAEAPAAGLQYFLPPDIHVSESI
jgi:LacI family transcriptional regulator